MREDDAGGISVPGQDEEIKERGITGRITGKFESGLRRSGRQENMERLEGSATVPLIVQKKRVCKNM